MKISSKEFAILSTFLMKSLFFGPAIYSIIHIAKQNSWLSMLISFIISFIPLTIFYNLQKEKKGIIKINKEIGNLGILFNIFITFFIIFHASLILWNLINLINSQFLFQTPKYIIYLLFFFFLIYISNISLQTISKSSIIFFIINIILFIIPSFTLFNKINYTEFKPFLFNDFSSIILASLKSISFNVLPLFILLIIPLKEISNNFEKSFIKTYLYVYFIMFTIITTCIGILGVNLSNIYQYPEFHILKTINIGSFLQRIESLLSTEWIFDSTFSLYLCTYFINNSNSFKFQFKRILTLIIIFTVSYILFNDNSNAFDFYMKIYPYLSFTFFLIIPTFTLIIYKFKK